MSVAAHPPRLNEANDLAPSIPGPAIAHCRAWWPIDRLPWWCPACGALLGLCLEEGTHNDA